MLRQLILVLTCRQCYGAIFHLNATEYERMPPLFELDEYSACLNEERGKYCVVKVELQPGSNDDLMTIIQEYSQVTWKHYNHTYLERGICVRKTCRDFHNTSSPSQEDLTSALSACLNYSISTHYGLHATVSDVYYCDVHDERADIDGLDWTVAFLFIGILLINCIGTTYDYVVNAETNDKDHRRGNKWITSFSVLRNWSWLVSAKPDEERIQRLKGLHGFRSFTNVCTILAHAVWIIACGFTNKPRDFEESYEMAYYQVLFNGMVIVQTFFVISGFLLVYNFKIQAEKRPIGWMIIPMVMLIRWWRLSPALAAMLAFNTTWMRHLGSGPLWKLFVTKSVVVDCRKYWWYHLLYINNYAPEDKFCLIQTWHISADSQLFLLGLVTYVATQRRGRTPALAALLLLGLLLPALHVWYWDMDGVLMMVPQFYRTMESEVFHYLHTFGHNNIASFITGMAAGEFIYNLQQDNYDITKHKIMQLLSWLAIPAIIFLMYTGSVFYADGARASLTLRIAYASLHRFIMGLIVAFGVFAIVFKCDVLLAKVFEWRGWVVPSRLSYSMFLIHFSLIYMFMGTRSELGQVSFYYLVICHIAFVGLAMLFALPFFLLVEAPMNRLLKTVLDLGKSRQGEGKAFSLDNKSKNTVTEETTIN